MAEVTYKLIRVSEQKTGQWSGGETTEIAIYPPDSSYPARDFHWRISSATITAAESDFTPLPGYMRHLMILDGSIYFSHNGRGSELHVYDQIFFDGGLPSKSKGVCRDFNLMLGEGWQGSLSVAEPGCGRAGCGFTGFYSLEDGTVIGGGGLPEMVLGFKDFLLVEGDGFEYNINAKVVLVEIRR